MDTSLSKLRDSEEQGSLACCSPCGHKESDMTKGLKDSVMKYTSTNIIFLRYNYFYKAQFSRLLNFEDKILHLV